MNEGDLKPWEHVVTEEEFRVGNNRIIEEFRANGGKVGGDYEGSNLLLLTTIGARSGRRHTVPLAYQAHGSRLIISSLVETAYPDWYHNLRANPTVSIELGTEVFEATATITSGEERARLWDTVIESWPWLVDHQKTTSLQIPLVVLQR